jgi:hypothetical protein
MSLCIEFAGVNQTGESARRKKREPVFRGKLTRKVEAITFSALGRFRPIGSVI